MKNPPEGVGGVDLNVGVVWQYWVGGGYILAAVLLGSPGSMGKGRVNYYVTGLVGNIPVNAVFGYKVVTGNDSDAVLGSPEAAAVSGGVAGHGGGSGYIHI